MVSFWSRFKRLRVDMALPVLNKEMRARMRGTRTPGLLFIVTILAIIVSLFVLIPAWDNFGADAVSMGQGMAQAGKTLFSVMTWLEAILCFLIVPALTAGAIAIEREQQTFEMLMLTRLSGANIVLGKLSSSLIFIVVMLLCALPVVAISFLLGGVDPANLCWSLALMLAMACYFGAVGLYCSSRAPRVTTAVIMAFGICLAWVALVPAGIGALGSTLDNLKQSSLDSYYPWYVTIIILVGAAMAIIPSTFISALTYSIRRRPLTVWKNLLIWGTCSLAIDGCLLLFHEAIENFFTASASGMHIMMLMLGNPAIGFAMISGGMRGSQITDQIVHLYLLGSVMVLLGGAWVFSTLTVSHLSRLRLEHRITTKRKKSAGNMLESAMNNS